MLRTVFTLKPLSIEITSYGPFELVGQVPSSPGVLHSFSACPKINKKSRALRPMAKEKQGTKVTTKRTIPALDLRPTVPPLRNATTLSDIRTSPIEDNDVEPPLPELWKDKGNGREVSRGAPSKDVKERAARHTPVVKLLERKPAPTLSADESSVSSPSHLRSLVHFLPFISMHRRRRSHPKRNRHPRRINLNPNLKRETKTLEVIDPGRICPKASR